MSKTYSCSFADCGVIFTRAYELKKHLAAHHDPHSVFHCPKCDFITLQKKNLAIHLAIHTGEKTHRCPHVVVVLTESPEREEQCDYRTNDPAALTKHRKKAHGYIPPPNRRRPAKTTPTTSPRKRLQKVLPPYPLPSQGLVHDSRRVPFGVPNKANTSDCGAGSESISTDALKDTSPFLGRGDDDEREQSMDTCWLDVPKAHPSNLNDLTFIAPPDEEMTLDVLFDPSLHPEWLSRYEFGYSMFNTTGMKDLPEPIRVHPPPAPQSQAMTGREGCLCPDWMVEAAVEGWDHAALEALDNFVKLDP